MFSLDSRPPGTSDAALVTPVLGALVECGPLAVVLIDGPSGAGKSTLADELVAGWPGLLRPTLVRLDDIYPGWQGLDAAIEHVTNHVLSPRQEGSPAAWQRYDWALGEPTEWHPVDPEHPLIVEGCGALARANTGLSDIRIWLAADDRVRKRRALARDGETFGVHWDEWQAEWESYRLRETPERCATLRLVGTEYA